MHTDTIYARHRFPAEVISHCVWLYFRFSLSYRDVEELMAERGVTVTYETIREWCQKFGRAYAKRLKHRATGRSVVPRRDGDQDPTQTTLPLACSRPRW
jgi:transposase-like protein